ncbi:MAG: bifunctional metallophosphatase/5'-nucleotidase [Bacteroides sp.]|nr:bifunctional metallophosphatase/5'-nucleotidase [Bacteroides sp.]
MAIASSLLGSVSGMAEELTLKIAATSDVHGNYFPYNFITRTDGEGSLARVTTRVKELRDSLGNDNVILLDNGDILQGQPTAYYYNFINTGVTHPTARMLNFMGYDAQTIGNHDVETGHAVYDRYRSDLGNLPLLGANVIDKSTGKPYLQPYAVISRAGVKVVVLGLLTPAIPAWLPETLWEGLEFEDMVESARKWVPYILETEKPDLLVGLFHSGHDSSKMTGEWRENASLLVAEQVDGFDIIFMGHDHTLFNSSGKDRVNSTAIVLNPANNASYLAESEVKFTIDKNGKVTDKKVTGRLTPVNHLEPDSAFMAEFDNERREILDFVSRKIGTSTGDFSVRDAYFGPSSFMQLLHDLQLAISGAEISLAAPLSFDAVIKEGDLRMSDMFTLYKYENMLYTMAMTGRELKDYLEMSYSLWTDVMENPTDNLLLFSGGKAAKGDYAKLLNPSYNFDSAAGIVYTVDVTKPRGEKIDILSMADGTPFDPDRTYKVAVNSYRANGGGDLLTKGAGIPHGELKSRVLSATDKDLRFYLIKEIEKRGTISPRVTPNWKFIPEDMVKDAIVRDRMTLFGD